MDAMALENSRNNWTVDETKTLIAIWGHTDIQNSLDGLQAAQFISPDLQHSVDIKEYPRYKQSVETYNTVFCSGRSFGRALPKCLRQDRTHVDVAQCQDAESWVSIHECLDLECPIHDNSQDGHLYSTDYLHNSDGKISIKDNEINESTKRVHAVDKDAQQFLCTHLQKTSDINAYPYYKLSIKYFKQSKSKRTPGPIQSYVSKELWKSPQSRREDINKLIDEKREPSPENSSIDVSLSSDNSETELFCKRIKAIIDVDISDLKEKYSFLFDPQYIFTPKSICDSKTHDEKAHKRRKRKEIVHKKVRPMHDHFNGIRNRLTGQLVTDENGEVVFPENQDFDEMLNDPESDLGRLHELISQSNSGTITPETASSPLTQPGSAVATPMSISSGSVQSIGIHTPKQSTRNSISHLSPVSVSSISYSSPMNYHSKGILSPVLHQVRGSQQMYTESPYRNTHVFYDQKSKVLKYTYVPGCLIQSHINAYGTSPVSPLVVNNTSQSPHVPPSPLISDVESVRGSPMIHCSIYSPKDSTGIVYDYSTVRDEPTFNINRWQEHIQENHMECDANFNQNNSDCIETHYKDISDWQPGDLDCDFELLGKSPPEYEDECVFLEPISKQDNYNKEFNIPSGTCHLNDERIDANYNIVLLDDGVRTYNEAEQSRLGYSYRSTDYTRITAKQTCAYEDSIRCPSVMTDNANYAYGTYNKLPNTAQNDDAILSPMKCDSLGELNKDLPRHTDQRNRPVRDRNSRSRNLFKGRKSRDSRRRSPVHLTLRRATPGRKKGIRQNWKAVLKSSQRSLTESYRRRVLHTEDKHKAFQTNRDIVRKCLADDSCRNAIKESERTHDTIRYHSRERDKGSEKHKTRSSGVEKYDRINHNGTHRERMRVNDNPHKYKKASSSWKHYNNSESKTGTSKGRGDKQNIRDSPKHKTLQVKCISKRNRDRAYSDSVKAMNEYVTLNGTSCSKEPKEIKQNDYKRELNTSEERYIDIVKGLDKQGSHNSRRNDHNTFVSKRTLEKYERPETCKRYDSSIDRNEDKKRVAEKLIHNGDNRAKHENDSKHSGSDTYRRILNSKECHRDKKGDLYGSSRYSSGSGHYTRKRDVCKSLSHHSDTKSVYGESRDELHEHRRSSSVWKSRSNSGENSNRQYNRRK